MEISCLEVIREISNYVDGEVNADLRQLISEHLAGCAHCTAVYDGTRNVIQLVCDERSIALPTGFSQRLYNKLTSSRM